MKSTITMKKTLVLSIAIVSAIAGQVQAADKGEYDAKIYPGSICVPSQKDIYNRSDKVMYSWYGGFEVRDTSSDTTEVVCPVIRDNTSATRGLQFAQVRFEDNNPYADISCYVSKWDLSRNKLAGRSSIEVSRGSKGKDFFHWRKPFTSSSNKTLYTVNCKVPGKYNNLTSRIISIKIGENS